MFTAEQAIASIASSRFALANRAGIPDDYVFEGDVHVQHGTFFGRLVEIKMPLADNTPIEGPFIAGKMCFVCRTKDCTAAPFYSTRVICDVVVMFDSKMRPIGATYIGVREYTVVDSFLQVEMVDQDIALSIQLAELTS